MANNPSTQTTRVRIAVGVDRDGSWWAEGREERYTLRSRLKLDVNTIRVKSRVLTKPARFIELFRKFPNE